MADHVDEREKNITSRRKPRRRHESDEESEDENFQPSSSAKKKKISARAGPSLARRNLNFDGLPPEQQRDPGNERPSNDDEIISNLLRSHMQYKKVINHTNCFEKKTILDYINDDLVRQESMADMAMILSTAVDVYGFRVDRTFMNAQDTRSHIAQSFADQDAAQVPGPSTDTPSKKKRNEVKKNLGDWKARIDEDVERELSESEEEEETEEDKEKKDIVEDDHEAFLDRFPIEMEGMDKFLTRLQKQRKEKNNKIISHNPYLIEDIDEIADKSNKELSSNEYYQKAVSRYGEGNALSLLMHNAKVTSDAQAYMVHPRVTAKEINYPEEMDEGFLANIRGTLGNALAKAPKKLPNDLFPRQEEIIHESDLESDVEDEAGTMLDVGAPVVTEADIEAPPEEGHESNEAIPSSKKSHLRKSIMFRGNKVTIDRLWIPANINLGFDLDRNNLADRAEFSQYQELLLQHVLTAQQLGEEIIIPTIDLNLEELKDRSVFLEMSGIDEEMKELDNLWNSKVVKRDVTTKETEQLIKEVEESGSSPDDIIAKKRRILQPGEYVFFIEGEESENPQVPVDEFAKDFEAKISIAGMDMYDDFDNGLAAPYEDDEPMQTDFEHNDHNIDNIRAAIESPLHVPKQEIIPTEDVPDVPVAPGMIVPPPNDQVRNIGKEDDSHWKGNANAEPEKEPKRTRKAKQTAEVEKPPAVVEDYWSSGGFAARRKASRRFTSSKVANNYDKHLTSILLMKANARQAYQQFDFEQFTRIASMDKIEHCGFMWESINDKKEEQRQNTVSENQLYDNEGRDILGVEWMNTIRGVRLVIPEFKNPIENGEVIEKEDPALKPREIDADSDIFYVDEDQAPYDFSENGFDDEDMQPEFSGANTGSPARENRRASQRLKNKLQEIRDLQAADDYEEEAEIAEGIGGHHVQIKNSTIDQSKVKSYLKGILTNKMLDSKALKTVTEAASDQDFIHDATMAFQNATIAGHDISLLGSFDFKNTGIDPLEISRAVFTSTPEVDPAQSRVKKAITEPSTSQEVLKNAVVLSDFDVEGEHSLSSMMACLPFRAQRYNEKNMHVAMLFSVALQMCNENTLHCVQNKRENDTSWMKDFVLVNGNAVGQNGDASMPGPSTSRANQPGPSTSRADQPGPSRVTRKIANQSTIIEEDEEMNSSSLQS